MPGPLTQAAFANDLRVINRLYPLTVCLTSAGVIILP